MSDETKTEKPKTKKTAEPKSAVLGLNAEATPAQVDSTFKNFVEKTRADAAKAKAQINKAAASLVGKLSAELEAPRKALKKKIASDKQNAEKAFVEAKRAAKSGYDKAMNVIAAEEGTVVNDMSSTFNTKVTPINEKLSTDLAQVDADTAALLTAAAAEYKEQAAQAQARAEALKAVAKAAPVPVEAPAAA